MNIGVVCESEERLEFFRALAQGHQVTRISPIDPERGDLDAFDGVFLDGNALKEKPALIGTLQTHGFLFGPREEHPPCVIRHDSHGRLQLQCGKQAAAKRRAALGIPGQGTHTLIFQHSEHIKPAETVS